MLRLLQIWPEADHKVKGKQGPREETPGGTYAPREASCSASLQPRGPGRHLTSALMLQRKAFQRTGLKHLLWIFSAKCYMNFPAETVLIHWSTA